MEETEFAALVADNLEEHATDVELLLRTHPELSRLAEDAKAILRRNARTLEQLSALSGQGHAERSQLAALGLRMAERNRVLTVRSPRPIQLQCLSYF